MFTFILVFGIGAIAIVGAKFLFDGGSDSIAAWKQTWLWKLVTFGDKHAKPGTMSHAVGTTLLFIIDLLVTALIVYACAKCFGVKVGGLIGGVMALAISLKFRKARRSLGKEKEGEQQ
jgi:hypothetical protein